MKPLTSLPRGLLLCLVTGVLALPAPAGSGGSMYSMMGIGDLRDNFGIRSAGMGYTGMGIVSANYVNPGSPASWSRINRTRVDASVLYEGFSSSDGFGSRYLAHATFNGATLAIPVSPEHGIAIVGGFLPYSNVDYDTYTHGTGITPSDTVPYSFHHVGSGGIGVGKLGVSWMPVPSVAVGASLNYYSGSIDYVGTLVPAASSIQGGQFSRSTSYKGAGATFSMLLSGLGGIAHALEPLSIGATVSSRTALTTSQQTALGFGTTATSFGNELDTTAEASGQFVLPLSYAVGVAYTVGNSYLLAADFGAQLWRQSAINGASPADLRNSSRIGVGIEKLPSTETNAFWRELVALRLGATYAKTYYRPSGEAVNEWLVTGGITMPISRESRLSLAAEYGVRGKLAPGLVRDRVFRFRATLTVAEFWFIRMPEE